MIHIAMTKSKTSWGKKIEKQIPKKDLIAAVKLFIESYTGDSVAIKYDTIDDVIFDEIDTDVGDLMTFKRFKSSVDDGSLIDYDGYGVLATKDKVSNVLVCPSLFKRDKVKLSHDGEEFDIDEFDWATHVMWFNK
jgi:hypothetical protein